MDFLEISIFILFLVTQQVYASFVYIWIIFQIKTCLSSEQAQ